MPTHRTWGVGGAPCRLLPDDHHGEFHVPSRPRRLHRHLLRGRGRPTMKSQPHSLPLRQRREACTNNIIGGKAHRAVVADTSPANAAWSYIPQVAAPAFAADPLSHKGLHTAKLPFGQHVTPAPSQPWSLACFRRVLISPRSSRCTIRCNPRSTGARES